MRTYIFEINTKEKRNILALGPESSGNFSVFSGGKIHFCQIGADLLDERSFKNFTRVVLGFLRKERTKPDIILTDLHPRYRTSVWGKELARKYKAKNVGIQHHIAHIFSAVGDNITLNTSYRKPDTFYGIACDGTGYGLDGKIWGGEIFKVKSEKLKVKSYERVGHLENQVLIGGDLAVREPARMLIGILGKFLDKTKIYAYVRKYYTKNQFEVLCNQLKSGFNCQETSSTARILDAASVLLGFAGNMRDQKHGPVLELEKNSTKPYRLEPKIVFDGKEKKYILLTTPLFEYLVKNIKKDKKRLAATSQYYIAEGLYAITNKILDTKYLIPYTFFAGGMADNKIMADYLSSKGVYLSKKIPRGDAGLSFGQVICYLSGISKSWE